MTGILIGFVAHRALSGVRNGMYYIVARKPNADWLQYRILSSALILVAVFFLFGFSGRENLPSWLGFIPDWVQRGCLWGAIAASVISTILAGSYQRLPGRLKDLHLWTLGEQTFLAGGLLVASPTLDMLITLLCAVYPSVFVQKWIINWSGGQPWHYNGTDDPTGKYYSLPFFGWKIRRYAGQKVRLLLAISSIFVFVINSLIQK